MKYCSLCQRIIRIREEQGIDYFQDLCHDCKVKYIYNENRGKRRLNMSKQSDKIYSSEPV